MIVMFFSSFPVLLDLPILCSLSQPSFCFALHLRLAFDLWYTWR